MSLSIEELNLSIRAYNTLRMSGIRTVEQLRKMTIEELGKIENMKREYIEEIARSIIRLV
ncbi:DNA-directed RNA polymerase subunit alpha C-terminal domain-containing protein [Brevibacillus borstelensis]|uniref:DNA-directed RNA polymerase subunit alpha C-terminal domain-containing protein n=1 Tax=Brevibacillus borstelensis TaxID=45462 RepID=UPI002E1EBC6A|nr:DNA-directed RNA polymerase subunit alpha C-terminal domain-containing protein [Brevibacillus borstelensis]MED2010644.1 DNA-directed RNA polymerase subunit alpha C-terminal domain-containing protein [Brevibacillus borstelensis]